MRRMKHILKSRKTDSISKSNSTTKTSQLGMYNFQLQKQFVHKYYVLLYVKDFYIAIKCFKSFLKCRDILLDSSCSNENKAQNEVYYGAFYFSYDKFIEIL